MDTEILHLETNEYGEFEFNTEEEAQLLMDALDVLRRRAVPYANALLKLKHNIGGRFDEDDLNSDGSGFDATYTDSYCGDSYRYDVHVPISYLFKDDWLDKVNAEIKAKEEYKLVLKERETEAQRKRQEERDREQYQKLKEKFES